MNSETDIIPLCEPVIDSSDAESVMRCLKSGFVSSVGPLITEFEKEFASSIGAKYAVATASGTATLHVALKTLNAGPSSRVAVADLTFVASVNPALYCGAAPLLCDSEYLSWGMDPDALEKLLENMNRQGTPVSAIIPVHLFGRACQIDRIMEAAAKYRVPVIEDATEALGTSLHGRQAGTWGQIGCFSFNGNKLMTTGAGGMLVTDSKETADRARHLVNQARSHADRFFHSEPGFNYRMSSLAASLGLSQLKKLSSFVMRKKEIASIYNRSLCTIPGIELPAEREHEDSSFWLYSVLLRTPSERETLLNSLKQNGIQARRFFEPLHQQPYLKKELWTLGGSGLVNAKTGISDDLSARGINLPCSCSLSREAQQKVIDCIMAAQSRPGCSAAQPLKAPAQ